MSTCVTDWHNVGSLTFIYVQPITLTFYLLLYALFLFCGEGVGKRVCIQKGQQYSAQWMKLFTLIFYSWQPNYIYKSTHAFLSSFFFLFFSLIFFSFFCHCANWLKTITKLSFLCLCLHVRSVATHGRTTEDEQLAQSVTAPCVNNYSTKILQKILK